MKKYIPIFLVLSIAFSASNTLLAQNIKSEDMVLSDNLKSELRNYRNNTIMPVIFKQRRKLEAALSTADHAAIDDLRAFIAPYKVKRKTKMQNGGYSGLLALKHLFIRHVDELEIAISLVEKHHAKVTQLNEEISSQSKIWHQESKQIFRKYGLAYPGRYTKKSFWKCLGFLLLDPNEETTTAATKQRLVQDQLELTAFPNPASGTQTVSFVVPESGNIKIELIDLQGKAVKTFYNNFMEAGTQQLMVDLRDIPDGTYFYVYSTEKQNSSIQTIVKHQ